MNVKKRLIIFSVVFILPLLAFGGEQPGNQPDNQPEIRFNPEDFVYVYETNAGKGYYNGLIHFTGFVNKGTGQVCIDRAVIDVIKDSQVRQRVFLTHKELAQQAKQGYGMQTSGLLRLYDCYFRTKSFLGEPVTLSPNLTLSPNTAVLSMRNYLTFKGIPDYFKVTLYYKIGSGKTREVSARLKAVIHKPVNSYIFPLKGTWYVGAGADLHAHHRWVSFEEFALDLGQIDANGSTHKNQGIQVDDYYCFGRDVVAIAGGEVVSVENNHRDDNSFLRQPHESQQDYDKRLQAAQFRIMTKNVYLALGNYVVIRHKGEEYSCYAHLKQGTVVVKKGDRVKQGQVIGKVGHSGNSTEPHLHFQVNNGPDPLYSRGVPVKFSNLRMFESDVSGFLHSGDIVSTVKVNR